MIDIKMDNICKLLKVKKSLELKDLKILVRQEIKQLEKIIV